MEPVKVFVETGKKKTFAGALDWPGWCRSGKDENNALQTLIEYGPRYALVFRDFGIDFHPPNAESDLIVVERHAGSVSTDFGAPAIMLDVDRGPMSRSELKRSKTLLLAYWQAFDHAVEWAADKELRKGPRGGGRDQEQIMRHVLEADRQYLRRLAWTQKREDQEKLPKELQQTRNDILSALEIAVKGGLPESGPHGGIIWSPRYFIRRVAWHVLDHAWEIEDRVE